MHAGPVEFQFFYFFKSEASFKFSNFCSPELPHHCLPNRDKVTDTAGGHEQNTIESRNARKSRCSEARRRCGAERRS